MAQVGWELRCTEDCGEILAFRDGAPLPFARLQRRIGRQRLTPAVLPEAPVALIAYDLLEEDGKDRERPPVR